jgi:Na+/phosphate symporter
MAGQRRAGIWGINHRIRLIKFLTRLFLFLFSLLIFILALVCMKEGARPLAPLIRNHFSVNSSASALGFGWLSASLALSGSPVAATALALLDAQVLLPAEAFAMISGSRLGASFVVLVLGFIYLLRGKKREISLGVGLLSLLVTQTMYLLVIPLGFLILSQGWLKNWDVRQPTDMPSLFNRLFQPLINYLDLVLPSWSLFLIGFGMILLSLWMFDRTLPNIHLEETSLGQVHHLLYRPVVNFLLGAGITILTMSVSVSLSLLVPLSVRGYIRRENVIPYILGANITTFIDTLMAAVLLANPIAVTIVLVQIASVSIVSIWILLIGFRFYERLLERLVTLIGQRRSFIMAYILVVFLIPFILVILG